MGEGRGEGGATPTLADEKSGTVNWYFTDNQGTVRDIAQYNSGTNTTSVVDHLKFDSFGNITAQSNSANQPLFAYTGQMLDSNTGLYWYHARWYDPHTGRFISQDPSGFKAGDANLYRYVVNDPTNFVDPRGLSSDPSGGGQAAEEEQAAAAAEAQGYANSEAALYAQSRRPEPVLAGRGPYPVPPPQRWPATGPLRDGYIQVFNTNTGKFEVVEYDDIDTLFGLPPHLVKRADETPVIPERKMRGGPEIQESRDWEIELKNLMNFIDGRPLGQEITIYSPPVRNIGNWRLVFRSEWRNPGDVDFVPSLEKRK